MGHDLETVTLEQHLQPHLTPQTPGCCPAWCLHHSPCAWLTGERLGLDNLSGGRGTEQPLGLHRTYWIDVRFLNPNNL